jgi:hypothetical protein
MIKHTEDLPIPQDINEECNKYYLVKPTRYSPTMAMYLKNEDGEEGWYGDYYSKIVVDIEWWVDLDLE